MAYTEETEKLFPNVSYYRIIIK